MSKLFEPGTVAIVTGAARGIGRAIAVELACEGCNVVVNCRTSNEAAAETLRQVEAQGVRGLIVEADVSAADEAKALVDAAIAEFGHVDVLVNNAGITADGLLATMTPEDFNRVLQVNLGGTFNCMKAATRPMMRAKHGAIVNISSVVGVAGNAGQANYAASKAGIIGLTKSAAKELARKKVRVNAVAPGFIATDMTNAMTDQAKERTVANIGLGAIGQAQDIAHAVAFLASDKASYITGQVLRVDGGLII
ncbi:MAG: 3-oxoacyl-[acyl-carrier-protein] reductase [Eggerthellales bacterium]|nr:3-oxoacyl-[acyl-carrier-protein] reductase [Eggerthellales bacterium]